MIVGVLTTCRTQYTSFSRCNPMRFLSMELRQGSGLCSSTTRKYPGTEGCYMIQTVWNELDYSVDVCRITRCTYRVPVRYVTKTWSVVLLNKKKCIYPYLKCIVYDKLSKPQQSFRITLYFTEIIYTHSRKCTYFSSLYIYFVHIKSCNMSLC